MLFYPCTLLYFQMSDGALRCFINLVDRFIRKGQDPALIAEQGLTQELITRLMKLNTLTLTPQSSLSGSTPDRPSTSSTSSVINLLTSLCRGSASFTHVGCIPCTCLVLPAYTYVLVKGIQLNLCMHVSCVVLSW